MTASDFPTTTHFPDGNNVTVTNTVLSAESDTVICHNCHNCQILPCVLRIDINPAPMIVHNLTVTTVTVTLIPGTKDAAKHYRRT